MSEEEARAIAAGPPVANSGDRAGDGGAFYQRCRREGIWPQAVSGFDPKTQDEKFTPYMAVRNVTKEYPPTLMIHGSEDTDVPFAQSEMMAAEFRKHGVEHRLIRIEGAEHGLRGGDAEEIERGHKAVAAFVKRHLGGD